MTAKFIQDQDLTGIESLLIAADGSLNVVPAETFKHFTQDQISLFCVKYGFYCLPTIELIKFIKALIDGKKAIEIGAGNGSVGRALGIPMTDNFQQTIPKYKQYYDMANQATVPYGPDVKPMDAITAVRRLKPKVVLGCWVTHQYDPRFQERGGNEVGIKEEWILKNCQRYILVGNEHVHRDKPILDMEHTTFKGDWIISRSFSPEKNMIKVWNK